jgi:hypothetical protein
MSGGSGRSGSRMSSVNIKLSLKHLASKVLVEQDMIDDFISSDAFISSLPPDVEPIVREKYNKFKTEKKRIIDDTKRELEKFKNDYKYWLNEFENLQTKYNDLIIKARRCNSLYSAYNTEYNQYEDNFDNDFKINQ